MQMCTLNLKNCKIPQTTAKTTEVAGKWDAYIRNILKNTLTQVSHRRNQRIEIIGSHSFYSAERKITFKGEAAATAAVGWDDLFRPQSPSRDPKKKEAELRMLRGTGALNYLKPRKSEISFQKTVSRTTDFSYTFLWLLRRFVHL